MSSITNLAERARVAARSGNANVLEACFSQGLPIATINEHCNSDILIAAMDGKSQDVYRVLLKHGWDINQCLETCGSALNSACRTVDITLVKFLLANGAIVNDGGGMGGQECIIWPIIHDEMGSAEVLSMLLTASSSKVDVEETGAVLAAVEEGNLEMLRLLVDFGANVDCTKDWRYESNRQVRTPLYAAVRMGETAKALYLMKQGADLAWKGPDGRTVAQVAEDEGISEALRAFEA